MLRRTFLKIAAGAVGAVASNGLAAPPSDDTSPDFRKVAASLRKRKGLVVGVLDDSRLGHDPVPASLTWEHFRDTWGALPGVTVVPLNRDEVRSYSILFKGKLDVLVYRYGPTYPMDAASWYTGDAVLGFLKRGGAILTTGGVPFGNPVDDNAKSMANSGLMPNEEVYRRWVAPLGFKYYQHPVTPPAMKVEAGFLPSFPADAALAGSPIGIVVNNSSHEPVPKPYHGNVFPERYPARQVTTLLWGADKHGQQLTANAVLAQDFEDGSRRLHFSHMENEHPLAPGSPFFGGLMADILALLANRLVVKDVSTGYACYRDGEAAEVRAEFASFEPEAVNAEVRVEVRERESGRVADTHRETIAIPAGKTVQAEWQWHPEKFETDDYVVTVELMRDGRTVSRGRNGFVVWKDAVAKAGPEIAVNGAYFKRSNGETFMLGTNYYESTRGEIMWFRPDVDRISTDLRSMRACGVSYIRPHYHPQKWFRDYLMFQHKKLPFYFESLEKKSDPMPDEAGWRIFDTFIYLCQKLGIAYGGDLFTLVPEEMGDPRGWFPMTEALVSPEAREVGKKFLRQLSARYREVPCILWDLWNEPVDDAARMKEWTEDMRTCLMDSTTRRLITVGAPDLGAAMDFVGLHIGVGGIKDHVVDAHKPVIAQEVYLDRNEDLAAEMDQASAMREGILASVKVGLAGFAPWSWTRQMRLWQDSYEHDPQFRMESWDDRLGCQTHDDGTLKPAGLVFKDMGVLLRSIAFIDYDVTSRTSKTSLGQVTADADKRTLVHANGDKLFAAVMTTAVNWKGADVVSGTKDANVYVIAPMGDVSSAKKLYFKCDVAGDIKLSRSMPKTISLVELEPNVERKVADLAAKLDGDAVTITIAPTQERYWIAAEW